MTETVRNPFIAKVCESGRYTEDPNFPILLSPQFAQCGEDLIVVALIAGYCARHEIKEQDLTYCEIGAYHPIVTSSTYLLYSSLGMSGVLVEANAKQIEGLRSGRPRDRVVHAAITDTEQDRVLFTVSTSDGLSSLDEGMVRAWPMAGVAERVEVPAMHINRLFQMYFEGKPPVYLSIDVEGMDLKLLQAMNWEICRPYIVQAEPSDIYVPGSTQNMVSFMRTVGYVLMARTKSNLIFIDIRMGRS